LHVNIHIGLALRIPPLLYQDQPIPCGRWSNRSELALLIPHVERYIQEKEKKHLAHVPHLFVYFYLLLLYIFYFCTLSAL
jgi:hypothetical protein